MRRPRTRTVVGATVAFGSAALAWEAFARSGSLPPAITPPVEAIVAAVARMVGDGTLFVHVGYTLARIAAGMGLAAVVGVPLGMLMGRARPVERFVLPLVSVLSPIPSLAWVPLFILWFGLGNTASIALVFYAALFPLVLNTWTGVCSVNRLWIRAAESMGANRAAVFRQVVLPGALPFVIAGLRQAFARGWIAVVGGEMIAATRWGLGWVIFDSKEFLNTDVMLGSLAVIGLLGLAVERLVFAALERRTVERWGLVRGAAA
ncbi:MAG TPA: ABC transporter permease [Methylomirabilota bacterium]|jgi:ABC-type nitrate/sulfonate/bicarbonate transport system permease component